MTDRYCGCGADGLVHAPACARYELPFAGPEDVAAQVAAEDGYPACRAAIRHPSHAATRRHFAAHPMPRQTARRTA